MTHWIHLSTLKILYLRFIQFFLVHLFPALPCTLTPHVDFGSHMTSVFCDDHRCFIRLQYMIVVDLSMKPVIHNRQTSLRTLDCPVCHDLTGEIDPVALQFLLLLVQRYGIDILGVHNTASREGVTILPRRRSPGRFAFTIV